MQYTTEELQTILDLHKKWLYNSKEGKCADLRGACLRGADLRKADLCEAYLRGADLRGAYLSGADLSGADLCEADMSCAYLRGADLRKADLREADMSGAYLRGACLRGAYLRGADLRKADLCGADLRKADMCEADISGAYLRKADLSGSKNIPEISSACMSIVPESGSFIGYKKAYTETNSIIAHPVIVKLEIAADAKRSNGTCRKCRCSKAKVISITDGMGETFRAAYSDFDNNFKYSVGETVEVADFDDNRWEECAPGIHFFITRAEAENY